MVSRGDYFARGGNYKTNLESKGNPYEGRVGLIRVGEMLSAQSETILSKYHTVDNSYNNVQTYWTATPYVYSSQDWSMDFVGMMEAYSASTSLCVRPVIMIGPDVQITSGNGTFNSPYEI